jgi:TolA-binding protein
MRKKILLTAIFLLFLPLLLTTPAVSPDASAEPEQTNARPVAHWSMDDPKGITAADSIGDNHGRLYGSSAFSADSQVGTGSVQFDGVQDCIRVPNSWELNLTSAITITAWVNADTWDKKNARIVQKGSADNQYRLTSEWGKMIFELRGVANLNVRLPPAGKWVHIAATYDGLQMCLYYDGKVVNSKATCGLIATTADPLYIGSKDGRQPMDCFKGRLDDVAMFSWALDPSQIRQLYSHGVESFVNSQPAGGAGSGDNRAILSQIHAAISNIQKGDQSAAQAAVEELLAGFSGDEHIQTAILKIADTYLEREKPSRACELYRAALVKHPRTEEAIHAHRGIAISSIELGQTEAAESAIQTLLTDFSDYEDSTSAVYEIANSLYVRGKSAKAIELYSELAERWPDSEQAIWACVKMIEYHISRQDISSADAELDRLLSLPCGHRLYPEGIRQAAQKYQEAGYHEKALGLHEYNVERFPDDMYGMWSQGAMVHFFIRQGDYQAADAAYARFLTVFSQQPAFPREVYLVGDVYREAGRYDKARQLYQYVVDNWPNTVHALWAGAGMVKLAIALEDEAAAEAAVDDLIADFGDYPELPPALWVVTEDYYDLAFRCENQGLDAKADEYFRKVISAGQAILKQWPDSVAGPEICHISGICYERVDEYPKAINYYQKVVDEWPDYEHAWEAQFRIAKMSKWLILNGAKSDSEVHAVVKSAFKQLVESYPDCPAAEGARNWLEGNLKSTEGGQK